MELRRRDREVRDLGRLLAIVDACKVLRLGLHDSKGMYIVPLNFGYEQKDGVLTFYFHCAKQGRKLEAIAENNAVCFEMDCAHELISAGEACGYSYSYQSVMGNGVASVVSDIEEKKHGLSVLMKHQTGKDFDFDEQMADTVAVLKVVSVSFTGKAYY